MADGLGALRVMRRTWRFRLSIWNRWRLAAARAGLVAGGLLAAAQTPPSAVWTARVAEVRGSQAPFRAALSDLQATAVSADPARVGLNIVVRELEERRPRITLHLRNVTLYDALRYLAEVAGLNLRMDEHAVVLSRADSPAADRMVTRMYPVSPAIMEKARAVPIGDEPAMGFQRRSR